MTIEATFWAGAGLTEDTSELGGVQLQLGDLLIDPGVPPDRFEDYHGFPSRPRVFNRMPEMKSLGLVPEIDGIWRLDDEYYHGNHDVKLNKDIEVLATHSHIDHIGQLTNMGLHVPIHMHSLSMKIAHSWQHYFPGGRTLNQFVDYYDQLSQMANTSGGSKSPTGDEACTPRDIRCFEEGVPFEAGGWKVTAYLVDHSLLGAVGFIIETPIGKIGISGDFRLRGIHRQYTEKFIKKLAEEKVKYFFCEGSLLHFDHRGTEADVSDAIADDLEGKAFAAGAWPPRDCSRIEAVYNGVSRKNIDRMMLIPPEQAKLLEVMGGVYGIPEPNWRNIGILQKPLGPRQKHPKWQEKYYGTRWDGHAKKIQYVTVEDIARNQEAFYPFMPDAYMGWMLQKVNPKPNSTFHRLYPEPYTIEMGEGEKRILNRLASLKNPIKFEEKEYFFKPWVKQKMPSFHVTGHMNREETAWMMQQLDPQTIIIPYHGMEPKKHFQEGVARHLKCMIPIRGQLLILT